MFYCLSFPYTGNHVADANEAQIYSLLIGCRELHHLSGFRSVVEGDSQLVTLWGSSKRESPWHLSNWVEEIHFISACSSLSFHHVVPDANSVADALARASASCTDLAFDV